MRMSSRFDAHALEPHPALIMVELDYDTDAPLEVAATISWPPEVQTWTFARALLIEGLRDRAGAGDVQVWPHGSALLLRLSGFNPAYAEDVEPASGLYALPRGAVHDFLRWTRQAVPYGDERMDFDRELAALLKDETR